MAQLVSGDLNAWFDFPLIRVATIFNTRKNGALTEGGRGEGHIARFH